jgi:hypothetical protein
VVFTLIDADNQGMNGNTMATVRMILAGLMACGFAFADDVASADAGLPAQTTAAKAKPAVTGKKPVKAAKVASVPIAPTRPSKNASDSKQASTRAGSGRMQVEEPKASVSMGTAKESRNWQKTHARGLTEVQKQAFRERKEKMEGLIAVIKEKRKALRDAKPEERAVLARELHSLILEKDLEKDPDPASAAASTARVGADAKASDHPTRPSAQADAVKPHADAAKKAEAAEQRRQRIERYQSQKKEELRRLQIEKQRSGLDNGVQPGSTLSVQAAEED